MNIGIVTTWFERGAGYVSKQYREVLSKKHDVFIYARGGEYYPICNPDWDDEKVKWGKKFEIGVPTSIDLRDFEKWIKEKNLEIVFFNEQHWWLPVILCNKLDVKVGTYVDYYSEESVPLFENYDFIICNTKRHFQAFEWIPQAKYIPWGTDINYFVPKTFEALDKDYIIFTHPVGMSPERKGTDLLIKAMAELDGNYKVIINSQIDIKKCFPQLAEMIDKFISEKKLIYVEENLKSSLDLYHSGDVCVYPARFDGLGLTFAESISCGIPVITGDNPPMNEFVNDFTGKLIKIDKLYCAETKHFWPKCTVNIESLVDCMKYYIDNFSRINEFKISARKYAEKNFDWNENAKNILNIFENVKKIPHKKKLKLKERLLFMKDRAI